MQHPRRTIAAFAVALAAACGLPSAAEFSSGGASDAGVDAAIDATVLPAIDAAVDATPDGAVPPGASITFGPIAFERYDEQVDLTLRGPLDWTNYTVPTSRCAGCARWVGELTAVGDTSAAYNNDSRTFLWSNGTPQQNGSTHAGVFIGTLNAYHAVPISMQSASATITVYLDTFHTAGVLSAGFDGATADPASVSLALGTEPYAIAIRVANAAGSIVNVTLKLTGAESGGENLAISAIAVSPD